MISTEHQMHYCFTSGVLEKKRTNVIRSCKVLCQHHCHVVLEVPWYNRICTGNLSSACHFCVWVCTLNMGIFCHSTGGTPLPQLVAQRLPKPSSLPLSASPLSDRCIAHGGIFSCSLLSISEHTQYQPQKYPRRAFSVG